MEPVFVGRGWELAELAKIGAAAAAGGGAVVLLVGEAGIGKSALLERFLGRAEQGGAPVLTGRALSDEGAPALWPWRRVLEQAAARGLGGGGESGSAGAVTDPAGWLGPELVTLAQESELDPAAAIRFRAFERTARAFRAAAEPGGLIVALEDLHWADEASLELLRFVCGEVAGTRLLVVGTFREPDGAEIPGLAAVAGLASVHVVRLAPLAVGHVAECLRGRAEDGRVDGSWAAVVHRYSGGNPLFVRELADLLARERLLPGPAADLPVPPGLRRVVAQRLARLSAGCRDLLGGCGAVGEEIDVEELTAVAGGAADYLAEAVAAGVLVDDPAQPRMLRFSHDVVRRVCYEVLGRAERVGWHRRIADALEAAGPEEMRLGELARHRVSAAIDAAGRRAAVSACRRAATADLRRLAFASAERWYGEALKLCDGGAERCELLLGQADAAFRAGQVSQALDVCAAAMEQAERLGRGDLAAASALVVRGIGGPQAGLALAALCERAFAVLGTDDDAPDGQDAALRARLLAQHSIALADGATVRLARPMSGRAMELAEHSGDPAAIIDALNSQRLTLSGPEGIAELLALGSRMREAATAADRPEAALWGHIWRIDAALQLGSIAAVDAEIFELATLVERLGWPVGRWHLFRVQATRAFLAGRFAEAQRFMTSGQAVARQIQDSSMPFLFFAAVSNLQMMTGRADQYAEELRQLEDSTDFPLMLAARSVFHLRMGDIERASALFERVRPYLDDLYTEPRWTATMAFAGEAAARLAEREAAELCYQRLLPFEPYYVNQSPGCGGSMARVLGVLSGSLGELETADVHLSRAVSMETRIGALPFGALARLDHANVLARRAAPGDRDRAVQLAEAGLHTARRLGMAPTVEGATRLLAELTGARRGTAALTRQERTIAALVAQGRTNKEIADRLVVSIRTVETHVRNILRKAGLANRTQLAAWALRSGLDTTEG